MIKSDSEFLIHAMHNYDNPAMSSLDEFKEDIKKFTYIMTLFNRYIRDKEVKERLLLNHIIVIYNVFGSSATEMLYYKIPKTIWPILETYLFFLGRIDKLKTSIDFEVLNILQKL